MSFERVSGLYVVASNATATAEFVHSEPIALANAAVRGLVRASAEHDLGESQVLQQFLRRSKRLMFDLASTPLAPSDPVFELEEAARFLDEVVAVEEGAFPDPVASSMRQCVDQLRLVASVTENPMGDRLLELLEWSDEAAAVVTKSHFAEWVRDSLNGDVNIRVMGEREFVRSGPFETAVVVGPSSWFAPHLRSAPRGEMTCFVYYDFIRDREEPGNLFASTGSVDISTRIRTSQTRTEVNLEETSAEDLVPVVDWAALARSSVSNAKVADDENAVDARLYLLARGRGVFLEAVDDRAVHVLEIDEDDLPKMSTVQISRLSAGMLIVLRRAGGSGDYVSDLADQILGAKAEHLRGLQRSWKQALRRRTQLLGHAAVEKQLRVRGISSPNLQYRLWPHSIRTKKPEDFRILMDYVELGDDAEELWLAMTDIANAHRRAGHRARQLLEDAIPSIDAAEVLLSGFAEVRVEDLDTRPLIVARIEAISPDVVQLDEDELRSISKMEADLWRG